MHFEDHSDLLTPSNIERWAFTDEMNAAFDKANEEEEGEVYDYFLPTACSTELIVRFVLSPECLKREYFSRLLVGRLFKIYDNNSSVPFYFSRFQGIMPEQEFIDALNNRAREAYKLSEIIHGLRKSNDPVVLAIYNKVLDYRNRRFDLLQKSHLEAQIEALHHIHLIFESPNQNIQIQDATDRSTAPKQQTNSNKKSDSQSTNFSCDSHAFTEEMKQKTSPVSALFLLDSPKAISKCQQWLSFLEKYGAPKETFSIYFDRVRQVFETKKRVLNFDHNFSLLWQGLKIPATIRCHSIDSEWYEVELWLPGVIANELSHAFGDGRENFFCKFMPPAFYD